MTWQRNLGRVGTTVAMIVAIALIGLRLYLADHYAVTVRNNGTSKVEAVVTFPDRPRRKVVLQAGAEDCKSVWVKRDAAIVVRVGSNEDMMYVSRDLGEDVVVEVTPVSVRFVKGESGLLPWRRCW